MQKTSLALFVMLSLTGCVSPSPTIELNPQIDLNASAIGQNKPVSLQVIDARAQNSSNPYASAKIDPNQNITQLFTDQMKKGLSAYGFNAVKLSAAQQNQMTVKILQIDHGVASGLFGSNTETDVSAEVDATSPTAGTYRKTYYAHSYSDNYLSASANPSAQVNTAVNKLLDNILTDQALMQFLAK